jgi:hypothetical protein
VITNFLLTAILVVLLGMLAAVKTGFNQVITGLEAIATAQGAASAARDPVV